MFCIFWRDNTFRSELFLSTCACFQNKTHEAFSRNCNTFFLITYQLTTMHDGRFIRFRKCIRSKNMFYVIAGYWFVCPWTKYFTDFNINLLKVHFDNGTVQRHIYIHNVLFKVAYQWHAPKTLLKTHYHDHLLFWNKSG